MNFQRIGFVGYGEVGKIFSAGLNDKAGIDTCTAWDLKFADAATADTERTHASGRGVAPADSMAALCAATDLIISAVTASNTLQVAQEAARHVRAGCVFLDLNSASPGTKQKAAEDARRIVDEMEAAST